MAKIYTQKDQLLFLEALSAHQGVVGKALTHLKISKAIYEGWMEDYPAFEEAVNRIVSGVIDEIEEYALENAKKNLNMAKFMLVNHPEGKKRGYSKKVDVKGDVALSWADMVREAEEE